MSTAAIIIAAAVALVVLLAIGGMVVNARWRRARAGHFDRSVRDVNRQLAAAHAQDRGWEPSALSAAARSAFARERAADEVREESLVMVVDEPGTDRDKAVFRFVTDSGTYDLTLGRRGDEWVAEGVVRGG